MDQNGTSQDINSSSLVRPRCNFNNELGGWRAVKYILGNETFEKLAMMSLIGNLVVYLHSEYNMDNTVSADVLNIWTGFLNFLPLIGAYIADTYLGRYRTILIGTVSSFVGMGVLTLTAGLTELRPSSCPVIPDPAQHRCPQPKAWQVTVLYVALAFLAVGSGGLRPCNISFGADQFDVRTEKGRAQVESFCNWWYFSFTAAVLFALTAVVYIQSNVSWFVGFAIPTVCFALSLFIFLIGSNTYIRVKPQGRIFSDFGKVVAAAYRKRHLNVSNTCENSFCDPNLNEFGDLQAVKLVHTGRFSFLDKAAIVTDASDVDHNGNPKNNWRLCTVHQVEQLKCVVGTLPVWFSGIGCFLSFVQMGSFGILQAIQMNRSVGRHFQIPPAWLGLVPMISLAIWVFIYERIYVSWSKTAKRYGRLSMENRIKLGIVFSITCMVAAAIAEKVRRDSALKNGTFESPQSVIWLVPQFAMQGLIEAFASIAVMELLTTHFPENLKTVGGAIFFLSLAIASYLSSIIVNIVRKATSGPAKSPWLGGNDLNQNRLDYYFYIIASFAGLNFVYFHFFAARFLTDNPQFQANQKGSARV